MKSLQLCIEAHSLRGCHMNQIIQVASQRFKCRGSLIVPSPMLSSIVNTSIVFLILRGWRWLLFYFGHRSIIAIDFNDLENEVKSETSRKRKKKKSRNMTIVWISHSIVAFLLSLSLTPRFFSVATSLVCRISFFWHLKHISSCSRHILSRLIIDTEWCWTVHAFQCKIITLTMWKITKKMREKKRAFVDEKYLK